MRALEKYGDRVLPPEKYFDAGYTDDADLALMNADAHHGTWTIKE